MAILALFMLGIANFAMHKAVLQSDHPILRQLPWFFQISGGRYSLVVEFVMLLGAMLLVDAGSAGWAWGYLAYSLLNGVSAWAILTGRV